MIFNSIRAYAIFILLLTFLCSSVTAQTTSKKVELNWGSQFKTDIRNVSTRIVHSDETGTYNLLRESGYKDYVLIKLYIDKLCLQKFDKDLQLVKTQKQAYKQLDMSLDLQFMEALNNELIAFTGKADKKDDKNYLFYSRIDKNTLLETGYPEKLAEMEFKQGLFRTRTGFYDHRMSPDQSKVLIYYQRPYEKGQSEKFGFKIYDADMHPLWDRDVELPYNDELFSVERIRLGNDGSVYLVGKVYAEKKSDVEKGTPRYRYIILEYDKNNAAPNEYAVNLDNNFITDIQISIADNKDIICAGFYSETGKSGIKGSFFLTIDAVTKKIVRQSRSEFSFDFLALGLNGSEEVKLEKKAEKGKNTELLKYNLREIIRRDDGGAILVGEQYWVDVVTSGTSSTGAGSTVTNYYYHYNDILIINIGPDGEIEWKQKIPKRQLTRNDNGIYSSYTMKVMGDRLFFIFNDNPLNLFYTSGVPHTFTAKKKKTLPILVEVDKAGNVEREALFGQDETDLRIQPDNSFVTGPKEMTLLLSKKKMHQFMKVSFK